MVLDPGRWEDAYNETGDFRYGVLAVGKWGHKAPDWAFRACSVFLQSEERRASGRYPDDDMLLDEMADLLASGEARTKHAAARMVTGDATGGANIHRLLRLWDAEEPVGQMDVDGDPAVHKRLERAAVRQAKRRGSFVGPYNPFYAPQNDPNPEAD